MLMERLIVVEIIYAVEVSKMQSSKKIEFQNNYIVKSILKVKI